MPFLLINGIVIGKQPAALHEVTFLFFRSLCFPHTLMAAESFKGFWSTAPRSKLCPSWKSCISTRNSWARWAHQSLAVGFILIPHCLQVWQVRCVQDACVPSYSSISWFHFFVCGLLKLAMWRVSVVSCHYMFFLLLFLIKHPSCHLTYFI